MKIALLPFPKRHALGLSKLKALADDKSSVTKSIKVVFHRIENMVGKEEKCWLPAFFFFSYNVFEWLFPSVCQKLSLCGRGLKELKNYANFKAFDFSYLRHDNMEMINFFTS